jgi:arabinogalactan oligomer/maltooligosaccharide transport system permease protein
MKAREVRARVVRGIFLVALALFALVPIWFTVLIALNPSQQLVIRSPWPQDPSLANFTSVLAGEQFPFWRWFLNSVVIASVASGLLVLCCALSAYAFSRLRFSGRNLTLSGLFVLNTIPPILSLIAIFNLVNAAGDYAPVIGFNSPFTVILIYVAIGLVVNTYLMKGFFDSVPRELDEAATLDGASRARIFWTIILPLTRPMLAIVAVLGFIAYFNDYIIALTFLQDPQRQTLAVGLNNFIGAQATQWGYFAAGALLSSIPVIIVVLVSRRYLTAGLTAGATKS